MWLWMIQVLSIFYSLEERISDKPKLLKLVRIFRIQ
jgi:hypothetical protein